MLDKKPLKTIMLAGDRGRLHGRAGMVFHGPGGIHHEQKNRTGPDRIAPADRHPGRYAGRGTGRTAISPPVLRQRTHADGDIRPGMGRPEDHQRLRLPHGALQLQSNRLVKYPE